MASRQALQRLDCDVRVSRQGELMSRGGSKHGFFIGGPGRDGPVESFQIVSYDQQTRKLIGTTQKSNVRQIPILR